VARNQPGEAESESGDPVLTATAKGTTVPGSGATLADDGYERALSQCRSALSAARFVEARAHGTLALKLRPDAEDARECMSLADQQYNEEQAYVRGKTALQAGDLERAYSEFSGLSAQSPLRTRPEIAQATGELARVRLGAARSALPHNRAETANIAESVLSMTGLSSEHALAAQELIAQARSESQVTHAAARAPVAAARAPVVAPARPARPPAVAAPKPPARPKPQVAAATPLAPASSSSEAPAMELASACLARGDNECVIRALEGRASTERELGLLIETYRAIGDAKSAQKNMGVYLKRVPTARRADAYRKMLELQSE
jgi:hypothetical protein